VKAREKKLMDKGGGVGERVMNISLVRGFAVVKQETLVSGFHPAL
jgi:hypothetical protein